MQLLPKCSKPSASNKFWKSQWHFINLTFKKPSQSYHFTSFWWPNIYEEFDIWQLQKSGYYDDQIYDWIKQWYFIQHTPFRFLGTRESWMSQMLIHFGLQLLPECSKSSASNKLLKSKWHSINLTFRKPSQSYYFTSFWWPNFIWRIWHLTTPNYQVIMMIKFMTRQKNGIPNNIILYFQFWEQESHEWQICLIY